MKTLLNRFRRNRIQVKVTASAVPAISSDLRVIRGMVSEIHLVSIENLEWADKTLQEMPRTSEILDLGMAIWHERIKRDN